MSEESESDEPRAASSLAPRKKKMQSRKDSPAGQPPPVQSQSQHLATAYHEAGHAVMAMSLGRLIHKVTIAPSNSQLTGVRLGTCELGKGRSKPSKDKMEEEVLILLAGMVAESHFTGQYCPQGAAQDLRAVARLLDGRTKNQKQFERLQRRLLSKTEHILGDAGHSQAIESLAHELIDKTTISGRAVRHFYQQALNQNS